MRKKRRREIIGIDANFKRYSIRGKQKKKPSEMIHEKFAGKLATSDSLLQSIP